LASDISLIAEHPPVRILVHPEPVRVAYKTVRPLIPKLWESRKIDYMIHIGMASGRKYYSVERRGHRDGYIMKDVDQEFLGDAERRKLEGKDWIWYGLPEEIQSDTDIDDIWRRWKIALPGLDIRVSEDAGRYLCDFIYYSSLAYLTKKEEERRVVFLHVPVDSDETSVRTGVDITLELIRAIIQSGRMCKIMQMKESISIEDIDAK
jgi:pyroglutamyl-peptidase